MASAAADVLEDFKASLVLAMTTLLLALGLLELQQLG